MATSGMHSNKQMKRMGSRKSHSWWWDSHISPKNSKWLAENLEEMDQSVKIMLKLIEEDGDSFAKKAEMYYQKRPELISLVEEFYRMYRSLAERYDHVTGELRKNIPSDLQSQGSGISDTGSEPSSTLPSPGNLGHRRSSNRAAGFDFFLGSGGNGCDVGHKEGDETPTLSDSEEGSEYFSVNNDPGFSGNSSDSHGLNRIMELEIELRDLKQKLWLQEEANAKDSLRGASNESTEENGAKVNGYEQELRTVNEKLRLSEEEISVLKIELERYRSLESANLQAGVELSSTEEYIKTGGPVLDLKTSEHQGSVDRLEQELLAPDSKIKPLEEELRITKEKLEASEKQIASLEFEASKSSERIQQLHYQLDMARKDIDAWKTKFKSGKREITELQEILGRIKTSISDRDLEIMELKAAVSDAEQKIFPEKAEVKAEMSKLMMERTHLEEQIREWGCRGCSFEEAIRKINSEKAEIEETLEGEIELLKADIKELNYLQDLNISFAALKLERDNLNAEVSSLKGEVNTRDDRIEHLDWHLNQLHMEHVQLVAGMEELKLRAKQLEEEVERQRTEILEKEEEKREAIRQLCFSLEHYRNGYHKLRQDFKGRKRVPVLAA